MTEKQKDRITAEDYDVLRDVEVQQDNRGNFIVVGMSIMDFREQIRFIIKTYREKGVTLIADDFAIMGQTQKNLVIKKSGKYKIARKMGWNKTKTALQDADYEEGRFIVKAVVNFADGSEEEDQGFVERREPGRSTHTNATLFETACTRAILRAISHVVQIAVQDEMTAEEIVENLELKDQAQIKKKIERAQKEVEIKETVAEDRKIEAQVSKAQARLKTTKRKQSLDADIEKILNEDIPEKPEEFDDGGKTTTNDE